MKKRKQNRLRNYDYSSDNLYFVTSCVHNRICCFGEIVPGVRVIGTGRDPIIRHGEFGSSSVGTGRDLSLRNNDLSLRNNDLSLRNNDLSLRNDTSINTNRQNKIILNEYGKIAENQWHWLGEQYPYIVLHAFVVMPNHIHGIIEINSLRIESSDPVKIKSLSELMGAYKTTVSKQIHLSGFPDFLWQRSFHEHIIRDEKTFVTISDYIINNPINWNLDNFYF